MDLPGNVSSDAQDWDVHAAQWRASLASEVVGKPPEFFVAHPDQAHYLRELAGLDAAPEMPQN